MESDLLGPGETAAMLGITSTTLHRWIEIGKIAPAMRLAGKRGAHLFRRADVEALAQQRRAKVQARIEQLEAAIRALAS